MSRSWRETPPDGEYVYVYMAQDDRRGLLARVSEDRWCWTHKPYRVFDRARLEECAARSGWRYTTIDLPEPPTSDWDDDL